MRSSPGSDAAGRRAAARSGATLVEVCLALAVAGVVLAAFVPTFLAELRTSKVSEATTLLASLHRGAAAYWATPWDGSRRCLPPAAGPTPAVPSARPREVDFGADETDGVETWRALGFAPDRPVRYRYSFLPRASGCGLGKRAGAEVVSFVAEGDLDGDGALSRFERVAAMGPDGALVPVGVLSVRDRVE